MDSAQPNPIIYAEDHAQNARAQVAANLQVPLQNVVPVNEHPLEVTVPEEKVEEAEPEKKKDKDRLKFWDRLFGKGTVVSKSNEFLTKKENYLTKNKYQDF